MMERDFAQRLGALESEDEILASLQTFRFIRNYEKLTRLEYHLLLGQERCDPASLRNVAFVGSGPLPLTTLCLVNEFLPQHAVVTNYDIDRESNRIARRWMHALPSLRERVAFQTSDILDVPHEELRRYDVVVLAALVGLAPKMKSRILHHLRLGMKDGSYLLLRSAEGAKAFLYPVVGMGDLREWTVCSVTHPKGEVVNSVIVVTKKLDIGEDLWG
jgi:nicotianamine synthase